MVYVAYYYIGVLCCPLLLSSRTGFGWTNDAFEASGLMEERRKKLPNRFFKWPKGVEMWRRWMDGLSLRRRCQANLPVTSTPLSFSFSLFRSHFQKKNLVLLSLFRHQACISPWSLPQQIGRKNRDIMLPHTVLLQSIYYLFPSIQLPTRSGRVWTRIDSSLCQYACLPVKRDNCNQLQRMKQETMNCVLKYLQGSCIRRHIFVISFSSF